MPLVSRTFDQLIDFTRTSAATYVDASGRIVPTPASRNLLTFTQEFDNAVWAKANATIVANAAVAPDGTLTADKLAETAINGAFVMVQSPTMALNTVYSFSCYMKAAERSFGVLNIFTGTASCWTWYNLSTGTVSTLGAGATATITPAGNGWYRCTLTISTAASGSPNIAMWPSTANGVLTYTGTAGSGIFIWGAQLEAVPDANLVLGSELVTNGDFASGSTGWSDISGAWAVSGGVLTGTSVSANAYGPYSNDTGVVAGRTYRATFTIGVTSGSLRVRVGNTESAAYTQSGTYSLLLVATTTAATTFQVRAAASGFTGTIDNISVKEITGTTGMPTDYTRNNGGVYPPRFDYDPVTLAPRGLLVEEQRTNLLLRSEEFDHGMWSLDNSGATNPVVTANQGVAPDGAMTADRIVLNKTGGTFSRIQQGPTVASAVYTFSVWMRTFSGSGTANVGIRLASDAANCVVTGTWQRFSLTMSAAGANPSAQILLFDSIIGNDETADILVWGAQLEAGAFATSYIPTVASQVTRTADVATITGANFSQWYNQSEGTFVVEADVLSVANTNDSNLIALYTGTFTAMRQWIWPGAPTTPRMTVLANGGSQAELVAASGIAANATFKIASAYKTNDFSASFNGATPVTDTSGTVPTGFSQLNIGSYTGFIGFMSGHIRSIRYYPTRLQNSQLQALTA